jgi:hypothetical protein
METIYIIFHYIKAKKIDGGDICFLIHSFQDFVFNELQNKCQVKFYINEKDIKKDLAVLDGMGLLKLYGIRITLTEEQWENLKKTAEYLKHYPPREKIPSMDQRFSEIEKILQ